MSTPAGAAVAPYQPGVISGDVVQPARVISPRTAAARALSAVLKTVVSASTAFRSESDVLDALSAIDKFAEAFADQPLSHAVQETDPAKTEDVSKRKPPAGSVPASPATPVPVIDYNALAAAMIAAQKAQSVPAEPEQVHTITDAPATAATPGA